MKRQYSKGRTLGAKEFLRGSTGRSQSKRTYQTGNDAAPQHSKLQFWDIQYCTVYISIYPVQHIGNEQQQ